MPGYHTDQDRNLKREKIILSVEGEKRAEKLANEKELQNIDVAYVSNCVRTLETAKYLVEKQNIKVNIDGMEIEVSKGTTLLEISKMFNKKAACLLTVVDSKFRPNDEVTSEDREKKLDNMIRIALNSSLKL